MIYPQIVQNESEAIKKAYMKEYTRIYDRTSDHMCAVKQANSFLEEYTKEEFIEQEELQEVVMTATISELSAMAVVPEQVLNSIKLVDEHPFFVVYSVGEVGVSSGSLDGVNERKIWSFSAIKELASKIKNGAKIILGHTDNKEDKQSMGEIVHSFTKKLNNSLTALAVAWIKDDDTKERIKSGELDTCSIEGDVMLAKTSPAEPWYVKRVDNIRSLAIANSKEFTPGFTGAGVKAKIQELETVKEKQMTKEISMVDVKTYIAEHNVPIEELFSSRDIVDTNDVKDFLEKEKGKVLKNQEVIINEVKDKNAELKKFKDKTEIKSYISDSKHLASKDDKIISYIKTRLDLAFGDELTEEQKKTLVDENIENELKVIDDLGITFNDKKEDSAQDTDTPLDELDLTDPAVNDLIA